MHTTAKSSSFRLITSHQIQMTYPSEWKAWVIGEVEVSKILHSDHLFEVFFELKYYQLLDFFHSYTIHYG